MASPVDATASYSSDLTSYDWLINDWDSSADLSINVQGSYMVSLQETGFYGVLTRHVIKELLGGRKSVAVLSADTGEELQQVVKSTPPGAGQYRLSPILGGIEFSSASNGKLYTIKYVSSGTANRKSEALVSGYFDSGSRRLAKLLLVTMPIGSQSVTTAHNIFRAKTDNRIVNVRTGFSRNPGLGGFIREGAVPGDNIHRHTWDDENIIIYRGSTSMEIIQNCFIIYKEL